jgi:hypothetical protein
MKLTVSGLINHRLDSRLSTITNSKIKRLLGSKKGQKRAEILLVNMKQNHIKGKNSIKLFKCFKNVLNKVKDYKLIIQPQITIEANWLQALLTVNLPYQPSNRH